MKRQLSFISLVLITLFLPATASAQGAATFTPDVNLRLRAGPGTGYAQVGSLTAGEAVTALGRDAAENWAYVDASGVRGWAAAWLATLDGDFNALPVTQPDGTGALVVGAAPAAAPAGETAIVIRVIDGDTIEVLLGGLTRRVRYIGVDTPETYEPCYDEAAAANRALVGGQTVTLVKDVSETDRYGRLLRYVYVGDVFVNAELAAGGYAQALTYPPDVAYADTFAALAAEARAAGRGCWAASAPEPAPEGGGNVQITFVFYDGVVYRVESDEYAEITNQGAAPVNLQGWRLNADDPGQDFRFPAYELAPGQSCRVYTNEYHPETCGFSFGRGQAIWNNGGDCGHLYNPAGEEVSTYCY